MATRIPYCVRFCRIHWAARMTSLVWAMPLSSITSSETIPAVGAAPVKSGEAPAATPATTVPCPKPSPGELLGRELRFTSASTRPAKSARPESIPESTKAIVGAGPVTRGPPEHLWLQLGGAGQSWSAPTAWVQVSLEP